jgi:hypothetical protein
MIKSVIHKQMAGNSDGSRLFGPGDNSGADHAKTRFHIKFAQD